MKHPSSDRRLYHRHFRRRPGNVIEHPRVWIQYLVLILAQKSPSARYALLESFPPSALPKPAKQPYQESTLPAPFAPTSAILSPRSIVKFSPSKISFSPPVGIG